MSQISFADDLPESTHSYDFGRLQPNRTLQTL